MNTLLIAGTDTEVGKTVVTTALAAYWHTHEAHHSLAILKLLQTGIGDREYYQQQFGHTDIEIVTPVCFQTPVAPPIAAEREDRGIPLDEIWQALRTLQQTKDRVLVEGIGGLGCPVTWELTVADLAGEWRLPTVLVVPVKLGAIAQTVANVALAREKNVNLTGIILSCPHPLSEQEIRDLAPTHLLQSLTQIPVLGLIPYLDNRQEMDKVAYVAANLDFEHLF